MKRFVTWVKNKAHEWLYMHGWYRLDELQHWGHCGLCGTPMDGVFEKNWAWGMCEKCKGK